MSITVHLLGRPKIENSTGAPYTFRSRKSWALLALILLSERGRTRSQLASLLFAEAKDPLRALRWSLAEIRRGLGGGVGILEGDPVRLVLPGNVDVDVELVTRGSWMDASLLPGLGADLLDGIIIQNAPAFESWLLAEQRRVAAASEAILHEAAVGSMSRGCNSDALDFALRAAVMSPLDENHQSLLIRLYRLSGDDVAASRQFDVFSALLMNELGAEPGAALVAAIKGSPARVPAASDPASIEAIVEAGSAAVAAGAVDAGIQSLRMATGLADDAHATDLRINSRLVLAEALVHSLGGYDEDGLSSLYEADEIALEHNDRLSVAQARAELGYVDFLRARYDRADLRLSEAMIYADGSLSILAKAKTYLGSVASDRGDYASAIVLLEEAFDLSIAAKEPRRQAFALSMLGRVHLLQTNLDQAADYFDEAIALAESDHWLGILPWPQALRGEVQLARGDVDGAREMLRQAFARACQLGDPCWEGTAARGLALVAEATGETAEAFRLLDDARARCNRLADPYVWLDVYIYDAQCALGVKHDHDEVDRWVGSMKELASRTGMRTFTARSLLHGAALGNDGDAIAAELLAD